ncbi:hypothetical protein HY357_04215 [Candidatus Roizmanbacteria bacterium]|nr:hypothetical protein [Candidatus Roizmanbacteria bacterium]
MAPDLKQNLAVTLYLLFSHNYIAFVYLMGVIISATLAILKPSRFATLILIGFIVLLFSFEYDKHLIVPFREQTMKSLITETPHYRLQKLIDITIAEIFPILFYIVGWLLIFAAVIFAAFKLGKKNK